MNKLWVSFPLWLVYALGQQGLVSPTHDSSGGRARNSGTQDTTRLLRDTGQGLDMKRALLGRVEALIGHLFSCYVQIF